MSLTKVPNTPEKVEKSRKLRQTEVHVIESSVSRLDDTGNLFTAIIDLSKGTITLNQDTRPFTAKKPEDLDDIIEFFTNARDLLAAAPDALV